MMIRDLDGIGNPKRALIPYGITLHMVLNGNMQFRNLSGSP